MTEIINDHPKSWGWFLALGIFLMIAGGSAWFAPVLVGLIVETVVGIALFIGGAIGLVQVVITKEGWNARIIYLILGGFNVLAGLVLLARPLEGVLAITLIMIVAFFVNGLIRFAVGIMSKPQEGAGWMIFAGGLSVVLSMYLLALYPEVSVFLIGIVAGVLLVSEGAGYVRYAYGLKNDISMSL